MPHLSVRRLGDHLAGQEAGGLSTPRPDSQDAGWPTLHSSSREEGNIVLGAAVLPQNVQQRGRNRTHLDCSEIPLKAFFLSLFRHGQLPLAHAIGCWVLLTEAKHHHNFVMGVMGTEGGGSLGLLSVSETHPTEGCKEIPRLLFRSSGISHPLSWNSLDLGNSPATVASL